MNRIKTAAAAAALALAGFSAAPSFAQDLTGISPWGVEVPDGYGSSVFVHPYTGEVYTNAYGDVVVTNSSYVDPFENSYQSAPSYSSYPSYTPYTGHNPYNPQTNYSGYVAHQNIMNNFRMNEAIRDRSHQQALERIWAD